MTTPIIITPGPLTETTLARPMLSDRSLLAVIVRSSVIAISTISRPATEAAPMFWICSAALTSLPSPGPLTSAAIVAIDSAAIMLWLTPTTIVRRGHRQLHLAQQLALGQAHRPGRLDRWSARPT